MNTSHMTMTLKVALATVGLLVAGLTSAATTVNLTAQRATATLPDGKSVPMWQFCGGLDSTQTTNSGTTTGGTCPTALTPSAPGAWAPGPTITVPVGDSLTINLTNALPVSTSIVVLGQLGGGLGTPTTMASPAHPGQDFTTFAGNAGASPRFTPPMQGQRVKSFGSEVAAASSTTPGIGVLTWANLKAGTYIYETGTLPSLQAPMGLYGLLIVTQAPVVANPATNTLFASGIAYPSSGSPLSTAAGTYDSDAALLFSEIDPVQNAQVDAAAQAGTSMVANLRWNDPSCATKGAGGSNGCYPAAVNYAPIYFMINGQAFDTTNPTASTYAVGATYASGNVLLRLANAGLRTHIPAVVGLTMSLVGEDGNLSSGKPKLQSEVLLTAGKTYDAVVTPPAAASAFLKNSFAVFDRQGSLSTANQRDGGMHAYLLVGGALAPAAATPIANPDFYAVPIGGSVNGIVTSNDVGIGAVIVNGTGPGAGTVNLNPDGSFIYTSTGNASTVDTFQYCGNGKTTAPYCATVTLTIGNGTTPTTANKSCPSGISLASANFSSDVASVFKASSPGVLAGACDPGNYALSVASSANISCASLSVKTDGSFTATSGGAASCQFTYAAKDSQGLTSASATATVNFAAGSGLALNVVDAKTAVAISDYRWVIQEDLTFHHDTLATPSVSTRTLGTSFHRSHNPVVASGCVGPISCGAGQTIRGAAAPLTPSASPSDVYLDPTKRYYISVLPADANQAIANAPTPHIMGGAEVAPGQLAVTIALQSGPLVPAQLSVYVYEDNAPTNGQNELTEPPLGGFNIILWDPAGRTGDPAGQQTYDAFNMPMTNALLGSPGCPDDQNKATNGTTSGAGNLVGSIYTCPSDPNYGTSQADSVKYALAGHALIKNITPARYDVIIHPGAARANETWWQTETLEGTAAQDAFTGINEPRYFQEFGPPGFHTTVGFVNPAHIATAALASNLVACPTCAVTSGATITGQITSQHMSRPSNVTLWDSGTYDLLSSTVCRVALNSQSGTGPAVAAAECKPDGTFALMDILPGDYEVQIFDKWLDQIIQAQAVTVPPLPVKTVDLGNIPVLSWFTQFDQNIKLDDGSCDLLAAAVASPTATAQNRADLITCDNALPGIPNVVQSTRFRNGAMSNQTATDVHGNGILVEQFPLFNWYVTESDQKRFKQKRVDIVVDGGGQPDTTGPGAALWRSTYADGTASVRSEVPGSASYGLQSFISQRNQVNYIKTPYVKGENGGIKGLVVLASTRPYDDQRMDVQNIWEPLVPRVNVNLYKQTKNADGTITRTLVDQTRTSSFDDFVNTVLGADGKQYILGTDQVLRDPVTGAGGPSTAYPAGAQVNLQCPGQLPGTTATPPWNLAEADPFTSFTLLGDRYRCYDGWHNWNQVQAAPYDGRYVFPSAAYVASHLPLTGAQVAAGQTLVSLPPGDYVVEMQTPQGYEIVKEEDKNILIGDAFVAPAVQQFGPLGSIFILPDQATLNDVNPNNPVTGDCSNGPATQVNGVYTCPNGVPFQSNPTSNLGVLEGHAVGAPAYAECVGALHRVPDYLSIFPQAAQVAPFAGMDRALCDQKLVKLGDQMQAGTNFFVFTATPVAANATGIILDDTTSEYNAYSPDFGEKASVPFIPVSTKDFAGHEVSRTYSDQWGAYNLMLPSSWLVNPPTPSGYGPNMLVNCINDPGPILDTRVGSTTRGQMITDPAYNPSYSNFCYTNPFMPGQATYLDTPVVPIASFAAGYLPPDCAYPDATPAIRRVDTSAGVGPWLPSSGGTITITALGDQTVPNPLYAGPFALTGPTSQRTITRHYGFGLQGTRGQVTVNGVAQSVTTWTDSSITVTVPAGTTTGQLVVTADNGVTSIDTVTVTVESKAPTRVAAGQTIQSAVDAATPGDLILVDAGTYNELVIMWKPVRLQGVGAASVIINAAKYPTSKLETWRPTINSLFSVDANTGNIVGVPQIDPLPTQEITGGVILLEPSVLGTEEGAGITVLAKNLLTGQCTPGTNTTSTFNGHDVTESNFLCALSRIDGFSVTGGDAGGGIYVNGWAHGIEISNDRVYGNAGAYNGGIRIGVPALEEETFPLTAAGTVATTSGGRIAGFGYDVNVKIHNNSITKNGTVEAPVGGGGGGAGLSICSGTDGYSVDANWVCGNFGSSDGGGIGHVGFSQGGSITRNTVLFNQSFQQSGPTHGGGIVVTGEPAIAGALTLGSGDVVIDANLVRGNFAEGGHGGGIRLQQVNGADIAATSNVQGNAVPGKWHTIAVTNNMVVNNVAGYSGGGISLADALSVNVTSNTVASNDSAGIAGSVLATGVALPGPATGAAGVGKPSPAGISSEPTSAQLLAAFTGNSASGQRTANAASQPQTFENNIIWHNRSFFYSGDGRLCASNSSANATPASCVVLADQTSTGECVNGAAFWDIGVVGDTSPAPGAFNLHPSYSVLSSVGGYIDTGLTALDPAMADLYCNGARTPPELSAAINPPSPKSLQVNATVDEGNNYVNLRYGPLYLNTVSGSTGLTSTAKGDYHLTATSASAVDVGANLTALGAPYTHDFDGQSRPQGAGYDIGADELMGAQADLAITKTDGQTTAPAGSRVTYTIVVTNNGPSAVTGAMVNDAIPTVLTGTTGTTSLPLTSVTWTCTGVAGVCVTANGSGAIANAQVNLANGASASFSFTGTLPVTARVGSSLTNIATVTAVGVSDPNQANNAATDTDTITPPLADLSITKSASVVTALRGGAVGYTIVVTNNGPNPVTGAVVSDTRPPALAGSNWRWSCVPVIACGGTNGSNTNQTGDISKTLATLAPGSSVTFTVNATVSNNATNAPAGIFKNTATVTAPTTVTDPDQSNNAATASVTIVAPSATLTGAANFPDQGVGSTSPASLFTYTNTGGVAITLAATNPVTLTGGNAGNFALGINSCSAGLVLQPTNSCTFSVTFTPSAAGTRARTLRVTDAVGGATAQTLALSGVGVAPAGTLAPSPVAFNGQLVGSTSATATMTFTNTTKVPIQLRAGSSNSLGSANGPAVGVNGPNPSNFAIVAGLGTTCTNGAVVAAGGSCTISVTFDPNATGSSTATLHVFAATANASFATDALSGTGIRAVVTLSGSTALTTNSANRTVKSVPMTISNISGTAPLVIGSITIATGTGQGNPGVFSVANPGSAGTTACPIGGSGLAAGATCQVTVTYTPPNAGFLNTINGTLTVTDTGAATTTQTRNYTGN